MTILLLLALGIGAAASADRETEIGGDFSLTDHHSQPFSLSQLRGKFVLMFFGFTYCPNICPTELAKVASVLKSMEDAQHRVQLVFISIDPARDTPEKLKTYVGYFSPDIIGLTGSAQQIEAVAAQYQVSYRLNKRSETDLEYDVDHSANLYVIDPRGKLASMVPYGFPSSHVRSMLEQMLSGEQSASGTD